jgi:6-phosphofructokinase 1
VPISEVAGRNRLVPAEHDLLQAARSLGVSLGS